MIVAHGIIYSRARPELTMGFQKLAKTSPGFVGSTALYVGGRGLAKIDLKQALTLTQGVTLVLTDGQTSTRR